MNELKKQLTGEFQARLEQLGETNLATEEYKLATDGITKVADRIIEIEKIEQEQALKAEQAKADKKDKVTRNVIEIGKFVGGSLLTLGCFVAAMNFEKEGTLTTEGGRSALKNLLKFKF